MTFPTDYNTEQLEKRKFTEDIAGDVAIRTTASITGDINIDSTSVSTSGIMGKDSGTNADFVSAYASATTLTCTTLPSGVSAIKADDVVSIVQVATSGAVTKTYSRDDSIITAAGTDPTTLTVTGAVFLVTDTFVVYTNIPQARGDKVDLIEVAGTATDVNAGAVSAGTQRVAIATDDINQAAINASTTTMAGWDNAVGDGASVSGDTAHDAADAGEPVKIGGKAVDAQNTAVASGDRVNLALSLNGEVISRNHTYGTKSDRGEEIDPVDEHYVEEELIDRTNTTAATTYYPSSTGLSMGNFNNLSIQFGITDAIFTVEAKIDDSTDWIDITKAGYELKTNTTGNASFYNATGVTGILDFDDLHVRDVRIKSVTADNTNAEQYHIKRSAL